AELMIWRVRWHMERKDLRGFRANLPLRILRQNEESRFPPAFPPYLCAGIVALRLSHCQQSVVTVMDVFSGLPQPINTQGFKVKITLYRDALPGMSQACRVVVEVGRFPDLTVRDGLYIHHNLQTDIEMALAVCLHKHATPFRMTWMWWPVLNLHRDEEHF
ncbi:hypothetical protein IRJ41_024455, partial [Triplophysa rosa]